MKPHLLETLITDKESFIPHPPRALPPLEMVKHFRLEVDAENIAWLTFDTPNSAANVWNEQTLREFNLCLDLISENAALKTLVIRSAKDKITIAGADLKAVRHATVRKLEGLIDLGQKTFNRLADMPLRKIALIHGACLGGGLEMTLACDLRIASDSEHTSLGLPETQIGLIPAWGGSTRLPQILGLPTALDLILTGKQLKARHAKKLGLVEAVVPREHLEETARKWSKRPSWPMHHPKSWIPHWFIAHRARKAVLAKSRGLYLAPLRAIEVATRAPFLPLAKAMELEKHAILDLALTPETERLIDLFFRHEEASKKPWPRGVALTVNDVAVIGAGVMGSGIAHWITSKGNHVLMQDISTESLARGLGRIHDQLRENVKRRVITPRDLRDSMDRLTPDHARASLLHYPLVIEAATEDMALKKKIFVDLAARCAPDAILATNTSALSVTELAAHVPHPERVIGLHFFNPVHRMPLVEIITTAQTSDDVIATAVSFVQKLGKTPVVVKDSPGFIVNRILMPYLMEAVHLHDTGVPAELIDEAMLEFGMPMGPIRLLDEIGLDVAVHVAHTLEPTLHGRLPQSDTLERLVNEGKLGKKSGAGFYHHASKNKPRRHWSEADHHLMERVRERLVSLITDEARRCQDEGIARSPADIELAMILGTGFPPIRSLLAS